MILDSYSTRSSNVCNQLTKKEPSEEPTTTLLLKRSSPSPPSPPSSPPSLATALAAATFTTSVLNSPKSVDDTTATAVMMTDMDHQQQPQQPHHHHQQQSSRSPSPAASEDLDELETSSEKSSTDIDAGSGSRTAAAAVDCKSPKSKVTADAEMSSPLTGKASGGETKEAEAACGPQISQLVDNMQRLESTINSLRESTATQISQLEEMLTTKNRIIADLEDKLDQQRDYEEIKRELTFVRTELSHLGPTLAEAAAVAAASAAAGAAPDPKALESFLLEKSKLALQEKISEGDAAAAAAAAAAAQQMMASAAGRAGGHPFFNPFSLPQLQGLGNVESFGTLLGEEIATTYAKAIAKRDPSFLAMAAAAAANQNSNSGSNGKLHSGNNSNNLPDSLSPSQISNGDEAAEELKSVGSLSASTTPTSAMMTLCSDGGPGGLDGSSAAVQLQLGQSPLHSAVSAAAAADLGLSLGSRSYSPSTTSIANSTTSAGGGSIPQSTSASYDRLQQQLRCNVEKYMNETLNTLQISRCVRELLSMHNIGQRLFAKYVLGLSQGTVSELLSKPKPWDKLTEKGRDSYRKMHAWATDERCINLLKSLVPRKGKDNSFKQEDPVAEERIAAILSEAQRSMKGGGRQDFFSSPVFLNGGADHHHHHHHSHQQHQQQAHLQQQQQQQQHLHHHQLSNSLKIERDSLKNNNSSVASDNLSDNGSDREEKVADLLGGDRKSPANALNATALATINNFYRNLDSAQNNSFGESANRSSRQSNSKSSNSSSKQQQQQQQQQEQQSAEEELLQSPDIMRLYQDQLAKLIGQHIEEGFRNSANQNNNYEDVRNAVNFYNHELARSMNPFAAAQQAANPELFARLFSAGLLNGTGYLGGLGPLGLETLQQQQQSGGSQLEGLGSNSSSSNSGSRQKGGTSHPQLESPQPREHHHHHHHHGHNHRDHLSSSGNSSVQQQMDSRSKLDSMLSALKVEHPSSPSHNGSLNGGVGGSVLSNGSDLNGGGSGNAEDLAASPLQRMQSITNSLLSQSALPSLPTTSSRPAKAVLPPITQQQFDQYNNLNTEDIVKRVKEQLSQYSISQRLFGESVLGLSQGSVSDLLARPKPWHMLTQKGREPFIRMKMFLEDDNAIHKLVASQYKIAPEKLMRTGSFVAGTAGVSGLPSLPMTPSGVLAALPSSSTPPAAASSSLPLSATPPNSKLGGGGGSSHSHHSHAHHYKGASLATEPIISIKYEHSLSPSSLADSGARSNSSTPDPGLPTMPSSASSPLGSARGQRGGSSGGVGGMGAAVQVAPQYAAALTSTLLRQQQQQQTVLTPTSVAAASAGGVGGGYIQPSVYELAALTSDLDTQIITTRIKETLMAHNIGQKIFGEVVLGLSQGSVSELLSKPKPWHMLSIKGREPFIRMQLWLNDPNNIEKLQTLKNERREANKRRRTHMDDDRAMVAAYGKSLDSQLFSFSNTFGGLAGAGGAGGALGGKVGGVGAAGLLGSSGLSGGLGPFSLSSPVGPQQPTVKKARILFTEEQKEALRIAFSMDPYPSSTTAEFLAKELNLSIRTITNWFHNHRMRLKQINTSANNGGGGGNGDEGSNQTSTTATTATTLPYSIGRDGVSFDQSHFRNLLAQRLSELKLRAAAGGGSGGNGGNGSNTGGGGNISSNHSSNGSTNSSQSNSNHFGSVFGSGAGSPQPHHRFKYSSLHGGGGGGGGLVNSFQSQSVYSNNTNSCSSPGSTSPFQEEEDYDDEEGEEDMGTLDLSMTSQQQQQQQLQLQLQRGQQLVAELDKLDSTGRSSVQDDSDDGEGAEADSDEEQRKAAAARQLELAAKQLFGSSRRKPQLVVSSSSRRKAAQPQQWVAPVVEEPTPPPQQRAQFDDDYAEDSYEDDRDDLLSEEDEPKEAAAQDASKVASALINGNNSRKAETASVLEALSKRLVAGPNDVDDQKTDEEEDGEMEEDSVRRGGDNGNGNGKDGAVDSDTDQEISENISTATSSGMPPYKKLKTSSSSTSVMSKLAISDDSSNNILQQECVQ